MTFLLRERGYFNGDYHDINDVIPFRIPVSRTHFQVPVCFNQVYDDFRRNAFFQRHP